MCQDLSNISEIPIAMGLGGRTENINEIIWQIWMGPVLVPPFLFVAEVLIGLMGAWYLWPGWSRWSPWSLWFSSNFSQIFILIFICKTRNDNTLFSFLTLDDWLWTSWSSQTVYLLWFLSKLVTSGWSRFMAHAHLFTLLVPLCRSPPISPSLHIRASLYMLGSWSILVLRKINLSHWLSIST